MLTVGGLFSGIGGWELGLERAGMRVLWHCEADPFARSVLEHHWPDVPCYPDVRKLRADDIEPVDVICGGFPCQDISVAGRGAGIGGERSGLWSEMFRLTAEVRPRYMLVENVAALVVRGLDRVLADLASIGFDAEWDVVRASDVGAPHRRERLWLVAYSARAGDGSVTGSAHGDARGDRSKRAQFSRRGGADVADPQGNRRRQGGARRPAGEGQNWQDVAAPGVADTDSFPPLGASVAWRERGPWAVEPDVGRVADGVPARLDQLRCFGNALVPQIPEWIGRRIIEYEEHREELAA